MALGGIAEKSESCDQTTSRSMMASGGLAGNSELRDRTTSWSMTQAFGDSVWGHHARCWGIRDPNLLSPQQGIRGSPPPPVRRRGASIPGRSRAWCRRSRGSRGVRSLLLSAGTVLRSQARKAGKLEGESCSISRPAQSRAFMPSHIAWAPSCTARPSSTGS
jgi:hypothetical protein